MNIEPLKKTREPYPGGIDFAKDSVHALENLILPAGTKLAVPVEDRESIPLPAEKLQMIRLRLIGIIEKNEPDELGRRIQLAIVAEGGRILFREIRRADNETI